MSNHSPVINGDEDASDLSHHMSDLNMVSAFSGQVLDSNSDSDDMDSDERVSVSCEFDHMYANFNEAKTMGLAEAANEIRHLKEMLLHNLDLIQQQSEIISTKDKLLAAANQEKEMLKQRLERMERRISLKKQAAASDDNDTKKEDLSSTSKRSPQKSENEPLLKKVKTEVDDLRNSTDSDVSIPDEVDHKIVIKEEIESFDDMCNISDVIENQKSEICDNSLRSPQKHGQESKTENELLHSPQHKSASIGNSELVNEDSIVGSSTKAGRSSQRKHRSSGSTVSSPPQEQKQSDSSPSKQQLRLRDRSSGDKSSSSKEKTLKSNNIVVPPLPNEETSLSLEDQRDGGKEQKKIHKFLLKGTQQELKQIKKEEDMLQTTDCYYTPVGTCTATSPVKLNVHNDIVEVPSWRVKNIFPAYSMEGTENLDDDIFLKRHQKYETDEKRRKRWDIQRMRELRQYEQLKQRYQEGRSRMKRKNDPVDTFWPSTEDAQYLEVAEKLPVCAFGYPLPNFQSAEFTLPWVKPKNQSANSGGKKKR